MRLEPGDFAIGTSLRGRLPFDDYDDGLVRSVLAACRGAWDSLCARAREAQLTPETWSEDQLTAALIARLNELRSDAAIDTAFCEEIFGPVTSETLPNFNGDRLNKSPDMVFRTVSRSLPWGRLCGLFVECKIVSHAHPVRNYIGLGVQRFVDGAYAWTMKSGLMVAYARDAMTVGETLASHLARPLASGVAQCDMIEAPKVDSRFPNLGVWRSVHGRAWKYRGERVDPGPLMILHLWLDT